MCVCVCGNLFLILIEQSSKDLKLCDEYIVLFGPWSGDGNLLFSNPSNVASDCYAERLNKIAQNRKKKTSIDSKRQNTENCQELFEVKNEGQSFYPRPL